MSLIFKRKMPIPKLIKEQYPLDEELANQKKLRDQEIADVLTGISAKKLIIAGPCSADREKSVLDYVSRLARVQEEVKDKLIIIPRIYTNKPRTLCDGYMGMIYQPDPRKEEDILEGIICVRNLHLNVIKETGLSGADEMLYPEDYRYISDLVSYVAIGARSVENQQHRLTASGIDVPVGIKNPMNGSVNVLINSIKAVQKAHTFLYRGWEVDSTGNPLAHAVFRGRVNQMGKNIPNYYYENLEELFKYYMDESIANPSLIIDTNHSNSNKRPLEQIRICREVIEFCKYSDDIRHLLKGFMIESYIEEGSQTITGNVYGKSVTDPCLGWDDTKKLIYEIAEKL